MSDTVEPVQKYPGEHSTAAVDEPDAQVMGGAPEMISLFCVQ